MRRFQLGASYVHSNLMTNVRIHTKNKNLYTNREIAQIFRLYRKYLSVQYTMHFNQTPIILSYRKTGHRLPTAAQGFSEIVWNIYM